MYIFTVEEAQKDLEKLLEMVANGKEVAIGGKYPTLLHRVRAVANLVPGKPESCGSVIIGYTDEDVQNDELVKPLPEEIFDAFHKPRAYDAAPTPESR